jgi:tetratricopeptide (TPR) repeat protein
MKKDNVMFGVIGLLVGLIVGFIVTNSMNRSALSAAPLPTTTAGALDANANTSQLPPNHPPIGSNGGDANAAGGAGGGPLPQVQAAIDKAKQSPQDYEAQMTAADMYYQIRRFDEAATYYEAAVKIKPGDKEALVKLGDAYFDSAETASEAGDQTTANTKFPIAEKWYTEALAKDPKDVSVRTDLGLTFFLRQPRDIDRAIKEYKASLAIDPKHEVTLQNLAIAYREQGNMAEYQKTADLLKSVDPKNPLFTQPDQVVQP